MNIDELCSVINTSTSEETLKLYAFDELLKIFKPKGWWLLFFAVFLSFADCFWLFL
jgi:hypothetical protein